MLAATGADALMIGRAAQGRPWLFREIEHFLATGELLPPPEVAEIRAIMNEALPTTTPSTGNSPACAPHASISPGTRGLKGANLFRHHMNTLDSSTAQLAAVNAFFDEQAQLSDRLVYVDEAQQGGQDEQDSETDNKNRGVACRMSRNAIDQCIRDSLSAYFRGLDGEAVEHLQHGAGGRRGAPCWRQ